MIDIKNVKLTDEELDKCIEFSSNSSKKQQKIEFGQEDTAPRKVKEVYSDTLAGKIAEVAFAKIMKENYGLDIKLDFEIYYGKEGDNHKTKYDDQDAEVNDWRIDVKGTKIGHYMLIEWNKLNFRQEDNRLSHIYAMFSVGWDKKTNKPTGTASYEGAATLRALSPDATWSNTHVLRKGDFIPNTHTRLMADNYGIEFGDLNHNLDGLVKTMLSKKPEPEMCDEYRNPYTSETTIEIHRSEESLQKHKEKVQKICAEIAKRSVSK